MPAGFTDTQCLVMHWRLCAADRHGISKPRLQIKLDRPWSECYSRLCSWEAPPRQGLQLHPLQHCCQHSQCLRHCEACAWHAGWSGCIHKQCLSSNRDIAAATARAKLLARHIALRRHAAQWHARPLCQMCLEDAWHGNEQDRMLMGSGDRF